MGMITGFLDIQRAYPKSRSIKDRIKDYKEIPLPLSKNDIELQGARCMDCGIPFCHNTGCPLHNFIPEWNDYVYKGKWKIAYERLSLSNNFPEITGRICPAPCEASCVLSINSSPVTIKQIELSIIEYAYKQGWVLPRPPKIETGKKIAIIGSGPSGLAAAQQLRRKGHTVTVYEINDKCGGILRYGIPDFKLEKWILDRRIKQIEEEGVIFETNIRVGEDISANYLLRKFDVILLTMGSESPRDLNIPGRELKGIYFAMEYLTQSNKYIFTEQPTKNPISAKNKNVLVIGGGDTGSDCIGTAHRQGAKKIYQYEIMPEPVKWEKDFNPNWPDWPLILRTSSSHEEGCIRKWDILTKSFHGKNGHIKKATFSKIKWGKDLKTDKMKFTEIQDSTFSINIDMVFLAMGFLHFKHTKLINDLNIDLDEMGNIKTFNNYKTSKSNIFTAGDANTGASLVVRAIYHGREAAKNINKFLRK